MHPLVLDEADGMLTAECAGGYSPAGLRGQSGMLYFSTLRGVLAIDPAQFGDPASPPPALIEEVSLDGKPVPPRSGAMSVPPGSHELEIHFTAFNYAKPEQIRFRYRLAGEGWIEADRQRSVRFSQLPPGNYGFELSAANQDGRWNEMGTSLAFTVQPFAWQTWWFRVAALAALFGFGGFTTWWLVRRQHQRELQELERNRQHQAELAHVARVSTMGELAASVAHELNQPLGAILANAEAAELFLQQDPPALDELRAILADIRQDDERAGEVIRRMRALLRKRELDRQPLEINSVVEDVLQVVSGDAALRKTAISADLAPLLPKILGDRVHLQQVLLNLILNGMDAMAEQPRERRRLSVRTRPGADGLVELVVTDLGHGIEPDKLPRLFEPFYTTKTNGMGMGLSIARRIIEAHRGRIWAENNASGGAAFHVTLPVVQEERTDHS